MDLLRQLQSMISGKTPAFFRTPYMDTNTNVNQQIFNNKMRNILWSIESDDWKDRDKTLISRNIMNQVHNDGIILMHCNGDKKASAEALDIFVPELIKQGYQFIGLDKMLNMPAYQ